MSEPIAEHLSRLVDGDLDGQASRFVLRHFASDEGARNKWCRYHIAREALRGGRVTVTDTSFAASVALAVADEEHISNAGFASAQRPWLKPLSGIAVAASVAVAALVFVGGVSEPTIEANNVAETTRPQAISAVDNDSLATSVRPNLSAQTVSWGQVRQPRVDPRLNSYVNRHNRQAGSFRNASGLAPYVRYVITPPTAQVSDPVDQSVGTPETGN